MAIQVTCPGCGSIVAAPDEAAGKVARCGSCLEIITVPAAEKPLFELQSEWHEEAEPTRQRAEPIAPRRRRRPRAEPVPQPRTRWVLWLVVGGFLVLLFGGGAIGFAVWKFSKVRWEKHEPAGGGFRVELPAPPRDLTKFTDVKPETGVNTFGTVRGFPSQEYAVVWAEIDPWQRGNFTDDALLDNAVNELMKDGEGVQKSSDRTLTQNGFPAREVVLRGNKVGGTALFRVVVAETRLYMVIVGGGTSVPHGEYAQRFLNSFEIIDPNLFAARERRLHPERELERQRLAWIEAQRKAEAEQIEKKRLEDEEKAEAERIGALRFLEDTYTGDAPPDPNSLPGAKLVLTFDGEGKTFEARTADDATNLPLPKKATRGPGVRGEAIYLPNSTLGIDLKGLAKSAAYTNAEGQTISVWVKARKDTVYVVFARRFGSEEFSIRSSPVWLGAYLFPPQTAPQAKIRLVPNYQRDENWHHYAFVRRPQGNTRERQSLYIDGELAEEQTTPVRTYTQAPTEFTIGRVEHADAENTRVNDPLHVALDEFAVYDRALDAATIKRLAGRGAKPDR